MRHIKSTKSVRNSQQSASGFSVVELMIVLTILLIVAVLAVPNYMAARARANEASAASSVRAIISAQNLYRNTFGFYCDLPSLGGDYLTDDLLAAGSKSGYMFDSTPGTGVSAGLEFDVEATPTLSIGPSKTGQRTYYGDQSAVIRFSLTGTADPSSPPID